MTSKTQCTDCGAYASEHHRRDCIHHLKPSETHEFVRFGDGDSAQDVAALVAELRAASPYTNDGHDVREAINRRMERAPNSTWEHSEEESLLFSARSEIGWLYRQRERAATALESLLAENARLKEKS